MTMPEPSMLTPRRKMMLGLRGSVGGYATPGVSPGVTPPTINAPLQSVQFGGSPANSVSHDNPVSAATPNSPAASGMSGSGAA